MSMWRSRQSWDLKRSADNKYPVLANREVEHEIRLKEGESSIIAGILSEEDLTTTEGIPGLGQSPYA